MEAAGMAAIRRRPFPRVSAPGAIVVSGAVIGILVAVALLAPLIAPHDPTEIDLQSTFGGASVDHPLGTDESGRDVLSRLIYGARASLLGPLLVVALSTAIGVPLGLLAGYRGGAVDAILGRTWDVLLSFPALLLAIVILATVGIGFWTSVIAVTIAYVPLLARVVRGAVLVERAKPYVDAFRVLGYGSTRIVVHHVLPNIAPLVFAQATLNFGYALLDLAGLAFIGLGLQPPTPDWGQMLSSGRDALAFGSYLEVIAASVAIMVAVVSFNILGDALAARAERRA
jgi:peptide/nickel transport system permease protein